MSFIPIYVALSHRSAVTYDFLAQKGRSGGECTHTQSLKDYFFSVVSPLLSVASQAVNSEITAHSLSL